jgi:hypothetical protein
MKLENYDVGTREWWTIRDAQKSASIMTEHQIEIMAERMQDRLDKRFMKSNMSQAQYDSESREIAAWVEKAMELIKSHYSSI